jgi:hypothetical protein
MSRTLYLAALAYLGLCLYALTSHARPTLPGPAHAVSPPSGSSGLDWFSRVRPMCNPVEVDVGMRRSPPPPGYEGSAYQAACYALAGKIDAARQVILALPADQRGSATGVFLSIADPVADAGDDQAAAPMMRLVLEFSPDSYIALYHAGVSEYALGDRRAAERHLRRFLELYAPEDGFRTRAKAVLAEMHPGEEL